MPGGLVSHLRRFMPFKRSSLIATPSAALMLFVCVSAGGQAAAGPNLEANTGSAADLPDAPQPQTSEATKTGDPDAVTLRNTPMHILTDQEAIWTSPLRLRPHDLLWFVPLTLAAGAGIATDHRAMTSVVSRDPGFNHSSDIASNVMTAGLIAAPVTLFGMGHFQGDQHSTEAGILGAEALVDGLVVEQGMKLVFWRERPHADNARGKFFQSGAGIDSSFPSSHSVLAWASAAAIAGEYPSPWVQFGAYSIATGVSVTRVLGQEHFPTDVLVGSAAGWLVGHYVYRKHHRIRMK